MKSGICPKCESQDIIADERVVYDLPTGPHGIFVLLSYLVERPKSWISKTRIKNERLYPKAWVCVNCGYTELYINDLKTLDAAHEHLRKT